MNDFYTYELAYPESMGGAVFYVGKGKGTRILQHEDEARKGVQSLKCDIIRSIWREGKKVVKKKVAENLSNKDAMKLESQLIFEHGLSELSNQFPGRKLTSCEFRRQPGDMARRQKPRTLIIRGLSDEVIAGLKEQASLADMKCEEWLYQQIIALVSVRCKGV